MQDESGHVEGLEEQVGPERGLEVGDPDVFALLVVACREPAALVELAVGRQVRLRRDAQQLAAVDHDGAVVEAVAVTQRRADDEHGEEIDGCLDQPHDGRLDGVEHGILHHEIVDRVPAETQLGEDGDGDRLGIALPGRVQHGLGVRGRVGDRDGNGAGRDAREAVPVGALEREGCAHRPSLAGGGSASTGDARAGMSGLAAIVEGGRASCDTSKAKAGSSGVRAT